MYYPLQIPFILNENYARNISYTEETPQALEKFVICLWEMQPITKQQMTADHIILADGCIDLVVDYRHKEIGFAGMSKTLFDDKIYIPDKFLGARMKPGAFKQLTGLPATKAMDKFLPIHAVYPDFDLNGFFALPFNEAKIMFQKFLEELMQGKQPNEFVSLFDRFSKLVPTTTAQLYERLHYSPRQCQRLFKEHYGLTPQMVLSILRFQRCLALLRSSDTRPNEVMDAVNYYDQPHFIKDFKRNIGIAPQEYLALQNLSHIYNKAPADLDKIRENKLGGKETVNQKVLDKANEIIKKAANAHLAVMDDGNYPVVSVMSLTNTKLMDQVYMTTTLDSNKAKCLQKNNKASVCISNANDNITLIGEIEICTEQEIKSKCWQNWFSEVYEGG